MDLISIIIAVHNGELFIVEQLQSLINQSYKYIELIIIDDYSNDNTVDNILLFMREYPEIIFKLLKNDFNLGVNKTFEKGIEYANGTYVMFCDQDDIWDLNKIEVMYEKIKKNNISVVACLSYLYLKGKKTNNLYLKKQNIDIFSNIVRGASILIKKEYLIRLLPFSLYDLYDKWVYFNSVIDNEFILVNKAYDYYRIHDNNIVGLKIKYSSCDVLKERFSKRKIFYSELKKKSSNKNGLLYYKIDFIIKFYIFLEEYYKNKTIKNFFLVLYYLFKIKASFKKKILHFFYLFR